MSRGHDAIAGRMLVTGGVVRAVVPSGVVESGEERRDRTLGGGDGVTLGGPAGVGASSPDRVSDRR